MRRIFIYLFCVGLLAHASDTLAKKLYRYKDKNGVTVVNNFLPPEYAQKGYEILNERFQVIKRVEPAKSKEELEKEKAAKRAAELAAEKAKIAKQKAREQAIEDEKLMRQFDSIAAVYRTQKSQLASIDLRTNVANNNIFQLEKKLADKQSAAAKTEREGGTVSSELTEEIKSIQFDIDNLNKENKAREEEKENVKETFKGIAIKLNTLHAKQRVEEKAAGTLSAKNPLSRVFSCANTDCAKSWDKAKTQANALVTRPLMIDTDNTIISELPVAANDLTLLLSRVEVDERGYIVFDLSCQSSQEGLQHCRSNEVESLADTFHAKMHTQ